jgi:hypothetical protein
LGNTLMYLLNCCQFLSVYALLPCRCSWPSGERTLISKASAGVRNAEPKASFQLSQAGSVVVVDGEAAICAVKVMFLPLAYGSPLDADDCNCSFSKAITTFCLS